MKEIGEIELFDVTGGRNYTWKEKKTMEEFNFMFNERMKKGEISLEERDYIAKQVKYYFNYMNLLDRDDTNSYLFDMNVDWEDNYITLKRFKDSL